MGPIVGGVMNEKLHFEWSITINAFMVFLSVSRMRNCMNSLYKLITENTPFFSYCNLYDTFKPFTWGHIPKKIQVGLRLKVIT